MAARFHGRNGHKSAGSNFNYEISEQRDLGFGDKAELRVNGRLVGYVDYQQVVRLGKGQDLAGVQLRRPHPRQKEGEGFSLTLPWTVTAAMKERGLLDNPQKAFSHLNRNVTRAMREMNRHAYGRTTEYQKTVVNGHSVVRRVAKRVKVDLQYLVYRGFRTRAGDVSPQVTVYVLNTGRAANGKHYALDWKELYNAQQSVQAVWHAGVAYDLGRKAGIKCVPHRHSMRALGIDRKVKPKRTRQINKRLRAKGARGQKARDRAARDTRAAKPDVSWAAAVKNFTYAVRGRVERAVTAMKRDQQRRFARRCVRAAVGYCRDNSLRFSSRDVMAAAAHTALPHVHPGVFVRAFKHEMTRIERLGVTKVKDFRSGASLFTGVAQAVAEKRAVAALATGTFRSFGKLSPRQVARGLAAKNLDGRDLRTVQQLVGSGGVTFDAAGLAGGPAMMRAVTDAYKANRRPVYHVGPSGKPGSFTPKEFVAACTRTSHLVSLWRGLRSPGSLMDKLTVAEHIRRASSGGPKRGSLVVADVRLTDAVELRRIAEVVRKTKGHLLVVGQGAAELAQRVDEHRKHHRQQGGAKR